MRAVRRLIPRVIEDFRRFHNDPVTLERGRMKPLKAFDKWCSRYHMHCEAIYSWAAVVSDQWVHKRELVDGLEWGPLVLSSFGPSWPNQEDPSNPLAPVGALPYRDSEDDFFARAQAHWNARYGSLVENGYRPRRRKTEPKHFDWVVRYRLLDESFEEISRNELRDDSRRDTVRSAIRDTTKLIGLPPKSRGGRPRKRS